MNTANPELSLAHDFALYTHRHLFLTGKAGTGKTTFLRRLQDTTHKRMVVVAPTGVAAINAGGATIHSFFQLAPGMFVPGRMTAGTGKHRFAFSRQKQELIRALDLLVIDEVSMVRADLMDAIDDVLRRLRRSDKPFGGVQLLLIGDLQQLAPVTTDEEWAVLHEVYDTPYFFSALALRQTDLVCIELHHVYRQHDDAFVRLLNAVRDNRLDASMLQVLNARYRPSFRPPDDENWITLTTHNAQAAQINARRLAELTTTEVTFDATVKGDFPEQSYPTDAHLTLKVGAQVMFCKNDPTPAKAYYNGRIGRVASISGQRVTVMAGDDRIEVGPLLWENTRYATDAATATIREEVVGTFAQVPLRPAWAITIHKSQGLTFDHAIINAGRAFSHGQVYVALSRCRTLEGLVLSTPIPPDVITTDPDLQPFYTYTEAHVPTVASLLADRRSYLGDVLCSIFDFGNISMLLRHFVRLTSEYIPYHSTYVAAVNTAATQTDARLAAVGVRFQGQIRQLLPLAETYEDNPHLRQRVQAALTYYCKETAAVLNDLLETELPETDNARGRELLERQLTDIRAAYSEKMNIFIACLAGFTLQAYFDAKAKAQISPTEEKKRGRKKKTVTGFASTEGNDQRPANRKSTATTDTQLPADRDSSVYQALLRWRTKVASERRLPPAYVMPMRTLMAILQARPQTHEALAELPGIGPKTLEAYGAELIEILKH